MFLFYVLSVSLCLSSFSTCVCVIFNPVGTFRTVANYLFYALGLGLLLTFLFVALIGAYSNTQVSPEEQAMEEIVDETLVLEVEHEVATSQEAVDGTAKQGIHHGASAAKETVDAAPIQEVDRELSARQEVVEATLIQETHPENAALLAHRADCERLRHTLRPPPVEAQAATLHRLNDADAFTSNPATHDDQAPPCTSQAAELGDDSKKRCTDSASKVDGIPRFCEKSSVSREQMSDVGEQTGNASSEENTATYTETDKATGQIITARESKKIERWISQTSLANTHGANTFGGMLNNGDDANDEDEDFDGRMVENGDGGPLSENWSIDQDSDFQKALRVYMGMGGKCSGRQRRWGCSTPNLGSSGESEFQGWVRKTFMLEKVGERRKARSA